MGSAVVTAANTDTNGSSMAIGITDGTDTFAIMQYDEDANTTSDTATRVTSTQFMSANLHTGAIEWEATFTSFDSGGWTINYGDAGASAYQNAFLAIGQSGYYAESNQTWSAVCPDMWETQTLSGSPYFVPGSAVVEVAVRNGNDCAELSGGVKAVGSLLERRFLLREAEAGGFSTVVMHVQTNSSSQIAHYADTTADISFVLLGYWVCGTYVEAFDTFTAGASGAWTDENLCAYGVGPGYVAEIVMTNDDTGAPGNHVAGVETNGTGLSRTVNLQNAEAGGVDCATMFVKADTSSNAVVDLFADNDAFVDFYLVGYWSNPPLAYTQLYVDVGSPAADGIWQDLDLTASGVPDDAAAELVLSNEDVDEENALGVRENASSPPNREILLMEAEDGGVQSFRANVQTDSTATIEFQHDDVSDNHTFRLIGYWGVCDSTVSYLVTDLGAVNSANSSLGWHLNSTEKVAGFEEDAGGAPDAWPLSCGTFTALGVLGGSDAEAHGINNANMIVGWSDDGSGNRRAFRWTSGGGMVNLGTAGGRVDSEALSVNANSEIAGTVLNFDAGTPPYNRLAFLYVPIAAYGLGVGMNTLGTLGGTQSVAMDVNDSGRVVGGAQNGSGNFRPFRWDSGTMTDLGTLGGDTTLVDHRAEAVNSSGNIAGRSYTAGLAARAFYWNGSMTDLGVLTGGTESWAFGISDSNVVVGTSEVTGAVFRAFVWDAANGMRNLNNLIPTGTGWTLLRATDVNNDGFIVGFGTNGSAQNRAFLLTPSCHANGGGSALTAAASGSGTTDGAGVFSETYVDEFGRTLAGIMVMNPEPGIKVDYEVLDPAFGSDATVAAGALTRDGFADGIALTRSLVVATTALQEGSSLTVVLTFTLDEIAELNVDPDDLQLHVLDDPERDHPELWVPAGAIVGELSPTLVVGDSGFVAHADGTVDYWAVRGAGGTFAVGKPVVSDSGEMSPGNPDVDQSADEDIEAPRPQVPPLCGLAMLQPLAACSLVLLAGRWSPRRVTFRQR